ncbi:MAG: hypothetical protein WCX64_01910 [Candidatus Micrarchaeia archaeon]
MAFELQKKKVILGIALLAGAVFFASLLSMFLKSGSSPIRETCGVCAMDEFLLDFIPIIAAFSILIGAGVYYLMSQKIEVKEESLKKNGSLILNLLNSDERKVIERLIEGGGRALQAEITRLPDMSKVKSHRIIRRLHQRGAIKIERFGKTNIVKLNDDLRNGLV